MLFKQSGEQLLRPGCRRHLCLVGADGRGSSCRLSWLYGGYRCRWCSAQQGKPQNAFALIPNEIRDDRTAIRGTRDRCHDQVSVCHHQSRALAGSFIQSGSFRFTKTRNTCGCNPSG